MIGIDPATYPKVASSSGTKVIDAAVAQLAQGRWLIGNGIFASG